MADSTDTVRASGSRTDPGAVGAPAAPRRPLPGPVRAVIKYAGIAPFGAYVALGLIIPLVAVAVGAFQNPDTGAFTTRNINLAVHGTYLNGFRESLIVSAASAVIPGSSGCWSPTRSSRPGTPRCCAGS